jgi:hypothetical protein
MTAAETDRGGTGVGMGLGLIIGAAIGLATDNLALWFPMGSSSARPLAPRWIGADP